jgi:AcrR family transcriptional regulator
MSAAQDSRRSGRPRSPEAHAAIVRATLELALEGGLRGLSIEAIAARAGVGKATIYRRWSSKEELFAEAVNAIAATPPAPDTGSARGDFQAASTAVVQRMAPQAFRALPRLLADAGDDAELLEALNAALMRPRLALVAEILRRGVARGELRADLDVELTAEILLGPSMVRVLRSGGDPASIEGFPMRVWDSVMAGMSAGAAGPTAPPDVS